MGSVRRTRSTLSRAPPTVEVGGQPAAPTAAARLRTASPTFELKHSAEACLVPAQRDLGRGRTSAPAQARERSTWSIRLLLAAVILLPLAVLVAGGTLVWSDSAREEQADLQRRTDIALENAARVFESHELILNDMDRLTRGLSDQEIAGSEATFHARLAELAGDLPQVRDLFIWGRDGTVLASARAYPVPRGNASDRPYFQAMRAGAPEPYVSTLLHGKLDAAPFFNVTRRRSGPGEGFAGLIGVSVNPVYFTRRYLATELADPDGGETMALARSDASLLARAPAREDRIAPPSARFFEAVGLHPAGGTFTAVSGLDGLHRHYAFRRVGTLPIYVVGSVSDAAVLQTFRAAMVPHLYFGVPATLALIGVVLLVRRRSREAERATVRAEAETARRMVAERAAQASGRMEALGKVAGGVAHDFNNVLAVILGNAEVALRRAPQPARREIDRIITATRNGALLTSRQLAFSRRRPQDPERLELGARMPQLLEAIRPALRGDIELRTDFAGGGPWPVEVDPVELDLALLNLAANARDAMPRGGTLTVGLRERALRPGDLPADPSLAGGFIALSATDDGVGMPPEVLARAFEPFFTTKDIGRGTGLGLSQVYGFARQSGGTAWIDSTPGQGTTVTVLLPRAALPEPAPAPPPPAPEPATPSLHVLLVDDNAEVAEATAGLLEGLNCHTEVLHDPAAALARLANGPLPDLVISDVVMPGNIKGDDLVRLLRARHPNLPVALMTGYSEAALPRGDVPVLHKPTSAADLAHLLARLVVQPAG